MPPTAVVRQTQLDNGLRVLLKEVHAAPVVSTWIWYRVGSRDEVEGWTGISHWVEHMMFKGSSRFPKGAMMRAVNRHGGYLNAMTSNDFTAYYETLPSHRATMALELEADRMLTAAFDPQEVEAERTVVIAEREEAENDPRYVLAEEVTAAAFRVHPYHHQVIGWKTDLQSISRDELYAHYRRYYVPNNAVLVVVGDVDAEDYLRLIERQFATIPASALPEPRARPEPPQHGERRVTVRLPGSTPIIRIAYHTPPVSHPDYMPLVVLEAVLSGGKAMFAFGNSAARSARLYRALVETELASSVGSSYHPSLDPFLLTLGATVREGREPERVEDALLAEVRKLQNEPVTAHELTVAIRQTQAQFAYSSESVTSQALTLGFLEMVDHHERMDHILDELAQVTPDDVIRVAQTYLHEDNRVIGWFIPTEQGGNQRTTRPAAAGWSASYEGTFAYTVAPQHSPTPTMSALGPESIVRQELDNGIVVLIKENPASPSVTITGAILAGSTRDCADKTGLATMVGAMLRRGTRQHTYQTLNQALDAVGASLSFSTSDDETELGGRSLAEDFDLLVDLLAEMLMEPAFPGVELEKLRGQILTNLGILETDTSYRADRAFMEALYPATHPYHWPIEGTKETVRALTPQDVEAFYHTYYHPEHLTLSVVGAVDPDRALSKITSTLGRWRVAEAAVPWSVPPAETPPAITTRRVQLRQEAQVDLTWGVVGMPRSSPDYYPALMGNLVLGRLGLMGRLGENVRDRLGLAYYISSNVEAGRGPHPWTITAGVNPQHVDRALAAILEEVERLTSEPIRDEELADGRAYLLGSLPLHLETNQGIAGLLLTIETYNLGLDYLQRYPQIITAITPEDILRVAHQYLSPNRYVLAMAGTFD